MEESDIRKAAEDSDTGNALAAGAGLYGVSGVASGACGGGVVRMAGAAPAPTCPNVPADVPRVPAGAAAVCSHVPRLLVSCSRLYQLRLHACDLHAR